MRQPVDWVRPHPDLRGLRVGARTVSLLPLASGKQGGIHHCHTEWGPASLTQSDQPASRRLTGCGPHSPHHPSQPVMGGFEGGSAKTLRRRLENTEACTTVGAPGPTGSFGGPGGDGFRPTSSPDPGSSYALDGCAMTLFDQYRYPMILGGLLTCRSEAVPVTHQPERS